MDVLIEILMKWALEVEKMSMIDEDKKDWAPTAKCKVCGEPKWEGELDEWGWCEMCAVNEDKGEEEEDEDTGEGEDEDTD